MSKLFLKKNSGADFADDATVSRLWESPRLYVGVIILSVVGLIGWASVAEIDKVVRVEGKVIPAGRSQNIQHLEGGIIATIDVREGASVRKGDLLLTIDNKSAGANLGENEVKLNTQLIRIARLQAEIADKSDIELPKELTQLPAAEAERSLFRARREKLVQDISVRQSAIKQHTVEIAEAERKQQRLASEEATALQRVNMLEAMEARGAAGKLEVLDAKSKEQRLRTELSEASSIAPRARAAIAEEQTRIEALRAEFRTVAQNDLVTAMAEADRLRQIGSAVEDRLRRTSIRAPIDGTINHIYVSTVGGVVKPGESLIDLTPDTKELLIESRAQTKDRGFLHNGLRTMVRLSSYDAAEYGLIEGQVREVSADALQDTRGDPYYMVSILVSELPERYKGLSVIPGMTATADIVTGKRTLLAYLLSPISKFTYNMFRDPK